MTAEQNKRKSQPQKFRDLAREAECQDDEVAFEEKLRKIAKSDESKVCPECGHIFKGNGWDGIDAHWRSKHEDAMPYEDAWPLLKAGKYKSS